MYSFYHNTKASFAIIFSIALLPIMFAIGVAVDYSSLVNTRSGLQEAADAGALAGARELNLTDRERKQIAKKTLMANYPDAKRENIKVSIKNEELTVRYVDKQDTSFLMLMGMDKLKIDVTSAASISALSIEVALVLDVSGSMNAGMPSGNSRLADMKTAAKQLITSLKSSIGDKAKFSVVPFTMNVNIGRSRTGMVVGEDHALFTGTEWMGCVQERKGREFANQPGGKLHAYIWPPAPNDTSAGICKNPGNGTNDGYLNLDEAANSSSLSAQFDGPNRNCVRHEILPLTKRESDVETFIESLTAEGNDGTIIAPGVTWGLRALSPEWPFKQGDAWNGSTRKIMVVLTDGEQTTEIEFQPQSCPMAKNTVTDYEFKPNDFNMAGDVLKINGPVDNWTPYGYLADSDPFSYGTSGVSDLPDALMKLSLKSCETAKAPVDGGQITMYTIGLSADTGPGTNTYDLLNKCASKPEYHFYASDTDSLNAAFEEIATQLGELHLTH